MLAMSLMLSPSKHEGLPHQILGRWRHRPIFLCADRFSNFPPANLDAIRPSTGTPRFEINTARKFSAPRRRYVLFIFALQLFFNFRLFIRPQRQARKRNAAEALGFRGGVQVLSHLWGHSLGNFWLADFKSRAVQDRKSFFNGLFRQTNFRKNFFRSLFQRPEIAFQSNSVSPVHVREVR